MQTRLAFSYGRFSARKQRHGRSLARQIALATRFARRHKLTLDASLSCQDEGLSGFWGDHMRRGELSKFLALCGTDRVPRGSVLLIEDFDRLSRQLPDDAWEMLRAILLTGVEVAVLSLDRWFTAEALNRFEDRLLIQACQTRAHQESKVKSERLKDVWKARRKQSRAGEHRHIRFPRWLERVPGTGRKGPLRFRQLAEQTLLHVVGLAEGGLGCARIAHALNDEPDRYPTFSGPARWTGTAVHHILTSPALWGGKQQCRYEGKRELVEVGAPVPDVYPPVIERARAEAIVARLSARKSKGGRPARTDRTTLKGLLVDAPTGRALRLRSAGRRATGHQSVYVERWDGERWHVAGDYHVLETLCLRVVQQWTPDALAPAAPSGDALTDSLKAVVRECQENRAAATAAMRSAKAGALAALAEVIDRADDDEREALAKLERLTGAVLPSAAVLTDCQSLAQQLEGASEADRPALCLRANARLRELLSGVYVYRQDLGDKKAALYVQIWPRVGRPETRVVMIGKPPAGWRPLDLQSRDFRDWTAAT